MSFRGVAAGVIAVAACAAVPAGATRHEPAAPPPPTLVFQGVLPGIDASSQSPIALSRSGSTAIVGSPETGRVRIYRRSASGWVVEMEDKSSRGLGASVALAASGRVAIAGDPNAGGGKGRALVYRTSGGGAWVRQGLAPSDERGDGHFGRSVAISDDGNTAIVGGTYDDKEKGAAWVFVRTGLNWKQQGAKLKPTREDPKERFGGGVALSAAGDYAVVASTPSSGKRTLWAFRRSGGKWRLRAGRFATGGDFALSADARTLAIGGSGTVAVYRRRLLLGWRLTDRLRSPYEASGRGMDKRFGASVAITSEGRTLLVAGTETSEGGVNPHPVPAVHVLRHSGAESGSEWEASPWKPDQVFARGFADRAVTVDKNAEVALVGSRVYAAIPVVRNVAPDIGSLEGGLKVTITGTNLNRARSVIFGSTSARSYKVDSPTQITAVTPAHDPGTVHVGIASALGGSRTSEDDLFRYIEPPVVTSISPATGPVAGGTTVTITGRNFPFRSGGWAAQDLNTVNFGDIPVQATIVSTTELRVVSPPATAPGPVDVTVTTPGGTSVRTPGAVFTYQGASTAKVISFDELTTGGREAGPWATVTTQYAGVTFSPVTAVDFSKGPSPLASFAHSGNVALDPCAMPVEFCPATVRGTFAAPQKLVRVWVGYEYPLSAPLAVELKAFLGAATMTQRVTLPANPAPTPIRTPIEVAQPGITGFEVTLPRGITTGLAVDDVTFDAG